MTTIKKVIQIMECFSISQSELTVSQIAEKLGVTTPTLYRYLQTLVSEGFLERDRKTNTYSIGMAVVGLAGSTLARYDVCRVGQNDLDELAARLNMNTTIGILYRGDLFHLAFSIKMPLKPWPNIIGRRVPAHQTAMGKMLLAFLPFEDVKKTIDKYGWRNSTKNSICDFQTLERELKETYERQYAIDRQESNQAFCIGAPIRQRDGQVIAAISTSCYQDRFPQEQENMIQGVLEAAANISYKLGYVGSAYYNYHHNITGVQE